MVIILGKTASGKNFLLDRLEERGFSRLVTYTTRPMRDGEIAGHTYHYTTNEDFEQKIKDGFFLEYTVYETAVENHPWYYGTAKEDVERADKRTAVILNPCGFRQLKNSRKSETDIVIYLWCTSDTTIKRLRLRKMPDKEIIRRMNQDSVDFVVSKLEFDLSLLNDWDTDMSVLIDRVEKLV